MNKFFLYKKLITLHPTYGQYGLNVDKCIQTLKTSFIFHMWLVDAVAIVADSGLL